MMKRVAARVITAVGVICQAAAADFNGLSYSRNASLGDSVDIFWTIETKLNTIRVAVHAKDASGWAGFGVSEMGGMDGADIVFFEAAVSSTSSVLRRTTPFARSRSESIPNNAVTFTPNATPVLCM